MDGLPGLHHFSSVHFISKQAPQLSPLLKSTVLSAALFTPYPVLYKFPYPQIRTHGARGIRATIESGMSALPRARGVNAADL
uniref:Uncharacterized protein n=1 Tax=Solanum lycopersicum TaxID=4081 RepID=K4D3R3_SOLLC